MADSDPATSSRWARFITTGHADTIEFGSPVLGRDYFLDPVDGDLRAIDVDALCPIETALRNLGDHRLAVFGDMIEDGREDTPIPAVRAAYREAVALAVLRMSRELISPVNRLNWARREMARLLTGDRDAGGFAREQRQHIAVHVLRAVGEAT